jgi:hypothetical protein
VAAWVRSIESRAIGHRPVNQRIDAPKAPPWRARSLKGRGRGSEQGSPGSAERERCEALRIAGANTDEAIDAGTPERDAFNELQIHLQTKLLGLPFHAVCCGEELRDCGKLLL